ncbi:signal recognition particle protein [bacterium]|nr:signal recognition particle protein [bacterium]
MFESLAERLDSVFHKLRGKGVLREEDVDAALRELRRALLEADVHFSVAKAFVASVREKAVGEEILKGLNPAEVVVGIVHRELVNLMGGGRVALDHRTTPVSTIMLVGLQGSGKTSFSAKLAGLLRKKGRRPQLVGADVYRPAAMDQLEVLGRELDLPVHVDRNERDVVRIAEAGRTQARQELRDTLIVDTAGRLHLDEDLMAELERLNDALAPDEILLVVDAMTGQEAVKVATEFSRRLPLTGVLLSKLDGDARGGAALSVRSVTGLPIKYVGTGETVRDIEPFHPDRMAGRILGMGDVLSLVEKVHEEHDLAEAAALEKRMRKQGLTLEDFLVQLQKLRKMGPLGKIMELIPGAGKMAAGAGEIDEREVGRTQAIIQSMTRKERLKPEILNGSRRKRIAKGSGTSVQEVNRLLRQFSEMQKMMKTLSRFQKSGRVPADLMRNLGKGIRR